MSRYDSQGDFASPTSWTKFDLTQLNAMASGFRGATFDGRYVYFVPYDHSDGSLSGTVARYDTKSGFEEAVSWSTFDVSSIAAGATGFLGGEFDAFQAGDPKGALPDVTAGVSPEREQARFRDLDILERTFARGRIRQTIDTVTAAPRTTSVTGAARRRDGGSVVTRLIVWALRGWRDASPVRA